MPFLGEGDANAVLSTIPARGCGGTPPASPAVALPGEDLLLRCVAVSSWIPLCSGGAGRASSGDGEPLPWQLPAARCPRRRASGGQPQPLPHQSWPPATLTASPRASHLHRAPLPAVGEGGTAGSTPSPRCSASQAWGGAAAPPPPGVAPEPCSWWSPLGQRPCGPCTLGLF